MGLLVDGQPLPPEDLKLYHAYIRKHGIQQFINTWRRLKDVQNDELKFGDEIECGIFAVDPEQRTAKLSIRGAEVFSLLKHTVSLNLISSFPVFADSYSIVGTRKGPPSRS